MPMFDDMFPSKYLKASDFAEGDVVLTMDHLEEKEIGQGSDAKRAWVLYFCELDKPLVLNKTNTNTIAKLYGGDTDDWEGNRVTLYATEVQYQSEMVEAIRVRSKAPRVSLKKGAAAAPAAAPAPVEDGDDALHDRDDSQVPF